MQGAIVTMTKALAKDLIQKKGIRVNAGTTLLVFKNNLYRPCPILKPEMFVGVVRSDSTLPCQYQVWPIRSSRSHKG